MGYIEFKISEYKPKRKVLVKNENGEKVYKDDPKEKRKILTRKIYMNIENIANIEENYNIFYTRVLKTTCKIITKDNECYFVCMNYEKAKKIVNKQTQCGFKYNNKI